MKFERPSILTRELPVENIEDPEQMCEPIEVPQESNIFNHSISRILDISQINETGGTQSLSLVQSN